MHYNAGRMHNSIVVFPKSFAGYLWGIMSANIYATIITLIIARPHTRLHYCPLLWTLQQIQQHRPAFCIQCHLPRINGLLFSPLVLLEPTGLADVDIIFIDLGINVATDFVLEDVRILIPFSLPDHIIITSVRLHCCRLSRYESRRNFRHLMSSWRRASREIGRIIKRSRVGHSR